MLPSSHQSARLGSRSSGAHPSPGLAVLLFFLPGLFACAPRPEPAAIPLVDHFDEAIVEGAAPPPDLPPRIEWRFDAPPEGSHPATGSTLGVEALHDVSGLAVRDGRLVGRAGTLAMIAAPVPATAEPGDAFYALEVRLRIGKGTRLGASFLGDEKLDVPAIVKYANENPLSGFNLDLRPGDEEQTYTFTAANASFRTSYPIGDIRHVQLRFTGAEGAEFEMTQMRLVTLREHLAEVPSGVAWQGLGDVFRETIVSRSPERIRFDVDLPSRPFLDLAIGTVEASPVTFRVETRRFGVRKTLLERTVTTPSQWSPITVELGTLAERKATLTLAVEASEGGTIGFWGSPVVRSHGGRARAEAPTRARRAVVGDHPPPQGVILLMADTLRRDHLPPWGYDRETAPVISRLARQGVLFKDAISQATWTKVSMSSILTSLYPTTHGIKEMPDRLPASITTIAEAYRAAGYATFATSSVPFTGRLTNLQQGVEVLHESTSLPEIDPSGSKTARTYVDRLVDWIDGHRDVPFFAFLHVFDPHSPFEPYRPYENLWMTPEESAQFRKDMDRARQFIALDFFKQPALPRPRELQKAGLDQERYLAHEKAWYDASIRAMDVEVGRLVERLDQRGLGKSTLIAFGSDHGEEFLEHGHPFHGFTAYGEMLNVPMILWWPDALPGGVVVERVVENIDVMPTLLELSRLPVPERAQGQSLLPLIAGGDPAALGWTDRPAFAERASTADDQEEDKVDSWALVDGDWKLVKNGMRPEGKPEFELYDHRADPLNLHDVAAEHPDVVARLAATMEAWHEQALAARVDEDEDTAGATPEELERLRALGYVE